MNLGYATRSARSLLLHPREGTERVRGRIDRRHDQRQLAAAGAPASVLYHAGRDGSARLHAALGAQWPCPAAAEFGPAWEAMVAGLRAAGVDVGMASYAGWNDSDRTFAAAIWCVIAHLRPAQVLETGVAHGLTSRVILEAMRRNRATGELWSIDLPATDPALHQEIGVAVPARLRPHWNYIQGTSRERLPGILDGLGEIEVFVHDSLHTGRNTRFELDRAWPRLRPGGAAVVDDIDHSLAFRDFVARAQPAAWIAARHITGPGLWGAAIKAA
jgi:Methyltransferase domain